MGYKFDLIGAILLVMIVGMSVDYAAHLTHFYNEAGAWRPAPSLTTCYVPPAHHELLPASGYLVPANCLPATTIYHLLPATYSLLPTAYYLLPTPPRRHALRQGPRRATRRGSLRGVQ